MHAALFMVHPHVSTRASLLTTYIKPCIPYVCRTKISHNLYPSTTLLHGGGVQSPSEDARHPWTMRGANREYTLRVYVYTYKTRAI